MKRMHDISPPISEAIDVWPGDTEFCRNVILDTNKGDNITLSSVTTTLHLGAHTDGPNHYAITHDGIESRDLGIYIGSCQVIAVNKKRGERIHASDLRNIKVTSPRVLFKTGTFPNPNQWNNDFAALSADVIEFLAEQDVCLVGIDTPSIDLFNDDLLEAHQAVYATRMGILEGIVLSLVEPGEYELIALPLPLVGADASPVRAVLREL